MGSDNSNSRSYTVFPFIIPEECAPPSAIGTVGDLSAGMYFIATLPGLTDGFVSTLSYIEPLSGTLIAPESPRLRPWVLSYHDDHDSERSLTGQ